MNIGLRYDMRAPDLGPGSASPRDLYQAAVEQCLWADKKGFNTVYLAEHHGAEDNYCPSPLILAAAIAGATEQIELHFSALCVTMHDPLRLAEDLAVLDLIAGPGRVLVTAGIGYRPEEFDMFGVDFPNRGKVFEEKLEVLRTAWRGEEFEYRGTRVRVTPVPGTPGGPTLYIGGNAKPSARRAARMGLGYRPATEDLYRFYAEECARLGHPEPNRSRGTVRRSSTWPRIRNRPWSRWHRTSSMPATCTPPRPASGRTPPRMGIGPRRVISTPSGTISRCGS